jgi:hypothetical protein
MKMRLHRRNLVLSNLSAPSSRPVTPGRARSRRIRRWLRIGTLLSIIGIMRFARTVRTRWRPILRVLGVLLLVFSVVFGVMMPLAFVSGMVVLGLSAPGVLPWTAETAMVRMSARSRHSPSVTSQFPS